MENGGAGIEGYSGNNIMLTLDVISHHGDGSPSSNDVEM